MKGGGLTWAGWLAIGIGGMLVYAGMTGQSLVSELGAVLSGRNPGEGQPAPSTPQQSGPAGSGNAAEARARAAAQARALPWPEIPSASPRSQRGEGGGL